MHHGDVGQHGRDVIAYARDDEVRDMVARRVMATPLLVRSEEPRAVPITATCRTMWLWDEYRLPPTLPLDTVSTWCSAHSSYGSEQQ